MTTEHTLHEAAKKNFEAISASAVFLPLWMKDYAKDPVAVMQVGMAILLDKPFYVMLEEGQQLPDSIKKIARHVSTFKRDDKKSMENATHELLTAAADNLQADGAP